MFTKTNKEINDFILNIKTIEDHKMLLYYMNSDIYSGIKLLISISKRFSIFWKVILPFIISLGILLFLSFIKPIGMELEKFLNITYVFAIFFGLVIFTIVYILQCKKLFISGVEKSMDTIKDTSETKE